MFKKPAISLALGLGLSLSLHAAPAHRLLFFSKSSGFQHPVISWKDGQPSFAEKIFTELGAKHSWEFVFSKDGSKFSPEYLAGFDAVIFYTTGNLLTTGTDNQPAMTPAGKQALFDYIKGGKGFIGLHCASDTFHTTGTPDRHLDATKGEDAYICTVGGEFIAHGAQQVATNKVIDPKFPGFETAGDQFTFAEEWYSLKNFNPDLHALTVIKTEGMDGEPYHRSDYPTTWARAEGKGRVYYSALGHREDVWTNPTFQNILVGAIRWTTGDVDAVIPPNLKTAAPDVVTNPPAEAAKK
ncbi:MAG: ThuA domain-containing protein [Akkermansiaceae bacterium]|nr:ThuA domain-containing protein [Akkermansiaceae bacterium]